MRSKKEVGTEKKQNVSSTFWTLTFQIVKEKNGKTGEEE
jgi:hypothetical protein